jgi:hypothetical protein
MHDRVYSPVGAFLDKHLHALFVTHIFGHLEAVMSCLCMHARERAGVRVCVRTHRLGYKNA